MVKNNKKLIAGGIAIIAIIVLLVVFFSCVVTIDAGHVGIKTQFGAVRNELVQPGLNIKNIIEKVTSIDCRVQKIEADANAASKDLQTISSKIAISYSIDTSRVVNLFKEVGVNYEAVIIDPAIQEVVKSVTATYTAEQLITKRSEVSIKMKEELSNKVKDKGIIIYDLNVINFDFSEEFNSAIEAKQVAQQNALKAQQDLERIKIEASQKTVQAKAEAESLRLQKKEISDDLLKLREIEAQIKAIEKWDGKLPTYTGDKVPFINVNP